MHQHSVQTGWYCFVCHTFVEWEVDVNADVLVLSWVSNTSVLHLRWRLQGRLRYPFTSGQSHCATFVLLSYLSFSLWETWDKMWSDCSSGGGVSGLLIARLVVCSLALSVHLLKCPWARHRTIGKARVLLVPSSLVCGLSAEVEKQHVSAVHSPFA